VHCIGHLQAGWRIRTAVTIPRGFIETRAAPGRPHTRDVIVIWNHQYLADISALVALVIRQQGFIPCLDVDTASIAARAFSIFCLVGPVSRKMPESAAAACPLFLGQRFIQVLSHQVAR
jgi:hypothetical protein